MLVYDLVLPGSGPVPASPANNDYEPGFAVAMMLKDLRLARDAAEERRPYSLWRAERLRPPRRTGFHDQGLLGRCTASQENWLAVGGVANAAQ